MFFPYITYIFFHIIFVNISSMHDISCMFWFQKFLQLKLWCRSLDALFVLLSDGFIFNALFSRWFDMVDVLYIFHLMWGDDFSLERNILH